MYPTDCCSATPPRPATPEEHADPAWLPAPQYWIEAAETEDIARLGWIIGFKDVTAPTNVRTMIATALPASGAGNTLPVLLPDGALAEYQQFAPLLLANLNSLAACRT